MPIFDYACSCGHRFEMLVKTVDAPAPACPACPACGSVPRRVRGFTFQA